MECRSATAPARRATRTRIPSTSLYWLVSSRTLGGLSLYPKENRLSREQALRLHTAGSAWCSGGQEQKGTLAVGQFADLAVLTEDYLEVPEERIRKLDSVSPS